MSQKTEITTKITQLIARCAPAPAGGEIDLDAKITSLDLDSLAMFEIVFEVEECFDIELDEIELRGIVTIRDLVTSVSSAIDEPD